MDESSDNCADDEHFGNHDYDDDTDDDPDDDNDHKKDSYTAAGAAPTQDQTWPCQAKPDPQHTLCLACFGMNGSQIGPVKL